MLEFIRANDVALIVIVFIVAAVVIAGITWIAYHG